MNMAKQKVALHLIGGKSKIDTDSIIAMFEKIKGRPATEAEKQQCRDDLAGFAKK